MVWTWGAMHVLHSSQEVSEMQLSRLPALIQELVSVGACIPGRVIHWSTLLNLQLPFNAVLLAFWSTGVFKGCRLTLPLLVGPCAVGCRSE